MLSWCPQWRDKDSYTRVYRTSKTSTHPSTRISHFFASQSLRPWLPFPILFKGCGEESQQSNSFWVAPNTSFLKHTQPLILLSTVQRPTTACHSKTNSSQLCEEGKDNRVTTPNKKVKHSSVKQCFRVVLGPSVAKTTQQQSQNMFATSATKKQPKIRGRQQPQTHNENDGNITQSQNKGEVWFSIWDKGKT